MPDELFSISDVARGFGVSVATLRYYHELGLVIPTARRGNVRHYGRVELRRLALVDWLHRQGLVSLADTATLLTDHPRSQESGREILTSSAADLDHRIRNLQSAKQLIEHLLTCPTDDPPRECTYLAQALEDAVDEAIGAAPRT